MGLNQSTSTAPGTQRDLQPASGDWRDLPDRQRPLHFTGQPNAMGGREMGYMGPGCPGQRAVLDPAQRAEVEDLGVPRAPCTPISGGGTVDMFESLADGRIKAVGDLHQLVGLMAKPHQRDQRFGKCGVRRRAGRVQRVETAEYADVVPPASLWSESEGVMINLSATSPSPPRCCAHLARRCPTGC